jgi:c-di-GMP-binding flagellar brake protein YcgR
MDKEERRQYKRMFFSMDEGPVAFLEFPEKKLQAIILDLSPGGVGMSLKKEEAAPPVAMGERVLLKETRGILELQFIENIEMKIRWVQNYDSLQHILFGCEFMDVSEDFRNNIREFIYLWTYRIDRR